MGENSLLDILVFGKIAALHASDNLVELYTEEGEKEIKKDLQKKFPTKEEIANSDWTSCCKGPILKKDLEGNFWVCNSCGKHHRISCRQRFDIFFGKIIMKY